MDGYRKIPKHTNATPTGNPATDPGGSGMNVSVAPLITMIAVLVIILIFCFCGAPAVRQFCRKRVCYCCPEPESEESAGTPVENTSTTPTIILLPFGRMLVVDRSVFTQFQTDDAGLDFMELSANLIRAHHLQYGSTPSILESDSTSKGLSPSSLGLSPPAYEDIYGDKQYDLPPSYSEVSLMFRQNNQHEWRNNRVNACLQTICVQNLETNASNEEHIIESPGTSITVHIENECVPSDGPKYLASEENFDEFDEAPQASGVVNRVQSNSSMRSYNTVTTTTRPKIFSKQSSF